MSQFGDTVVLVNRTKKTILMAQWDGAHYRFEPGEHQNVPVTVAIAAYKQNPIHGTEDPLGDPNIFESLFGIKGAQAPFGDVSPVEQSDAGERINRSLVAGVGAKVKKLNAGGVNRNDARMGTDVVDLSADTTTRA